MRKRGRTARSASRSLQVFGIAARLLKVTERKDHLTAAHMRAVARCAGLIGREMGLPEQRLEVLFASALLHDLGKIAVPNAILHKPGPLTPEENVLVRLHPVTGANILESIEVLRPMAPAVRYHHEHFDGEGYPEGLSREEIPLTARVILVADALDAITEDRPYQQGATREEALEEIARNTGTQFDPEVTEALLRVEERAYQEVQPRRSPLSL